MSFVGLLVWILLNEEFLEGGIVFGGMDMLVLVWDLKSGEKVQILRGYQMQVIGIVFDDCDIVLLFIDWYVCL